MSAKDSCMLAIEPARAEEGGREITGSRVGGVALSKVPDTMRGATVGVCPTGFLSFGPVFPHYLSFPPFGKGMNILCHCKLKVQCLPFVFTEGYC